MQGLNSDTAFTERLIKTQELKFSFKHQILWLIGIKVRLSQKQLKSFDIAFIPKYLMELNHP